MIAGITSFTACVPLSRMGQVKTDWAARNERAIASFDEDSLTMAVTAAINCITSAAGSWYHMGLASVDAVFSLPTVVSHMCSLTTGTYHLQIIVSYNFPSGVIIHILYVTGQTPTLL